MPNPLWNSIERRPRAFWRILVHGLLFFALDALVVAGITVAVTLLPSSSASPWLNGLIRSLMVLGAVGAVLLATWLTGRFLDRRPFISYGFHLSPSWWLDLGFGMALGAILMAGIFVIERAAGWVAITGTLGAGQPNFLPAILTSLVVYLSVGIYEEIISRGVHLRNMAEGLHIPAWGAKGALLGGYIISSTLFAIFHLGNPNATWTSTLALVAAGLLLGLAFILTGELAIPIGIHITWNFFQGNVFGFPVSGNSSNVSLIAIQQGGPELWTGGSFGPEAGLMGVLACFLGCLLIWLWVRWRRGGPAPLRTDLAVYVPPVSAIPAPLTEIEQPSA